MAGFAARHVECDILRNSELEALTVLVLIDEFFCDLVATLRGSLSHLDAGDTEIPLRYGAADNVELASRFTQSRDAWLRIVDLKLKRQGTIASGKIVKCRIEGDASGIPAGVSLGVSSDIECDTIGDEFVWIRFYFPVFVRLKVNTAYHVILQGDYSASPTDNILWRSETVSSGGNQRIKDATWSVVGTESFESVTEEWDDRGSDFAEPIIYTNPSGAKKTIAAIYDAPFQPITIEGVVYQSSQPKVACKTDDVLDATNNSTVNVRGTSYNVIAVEPDGTGLTVLILSKD
jgi:hypothetical protein